MKIIKNIIEYLIAISVIPAIVLTVISVTELKDVRNVQFELLSEEEGIYNITHGTYEKLVANKRIKKYELESNYPLITQEEMDRVTWQVGDIKNEIYIDENGQKRIRENVGMIIFDGSENWRIQNTPNPDVISVFVSTTKIPNSLNAKGKLKADKIFEVGPAGSSNESYVNIMNFTARGEYLTIDVSKDIADTLESWKQYLTQNPLTIYYELAVKNPNEMVIEGRDISITSDYVRLTKPNDFSNNPDGLLIGRTMNYIDRFEVTNNWINIYPKDITVVELASRMVDKTLYYELSQPRPVEVYDFSKFRLTFDKNRIRVVFDIDDEYYLWEITKDDKMIPINGQYDLGNIWTVKFYVYEIQQPLIRSIVLLIPLIVISGVLLYMFNIIKEKGISY